MSAQKTIPEALQALDEAVAAGESDRIPKIQLYIANALTRQGDYPAAKSMFDECIKRLTDNGDRENLGRARGSYGTWLYDQALYAEALEQFSEALDLCEQNGDMESVAMWCMNLGNVNTVLGRFVDALPLFERSRSLFLEAWR